jgi:A/G-specific adenine glycosylase
MKALVNGARDHSTPAIECGFFMVSPNLNSVLRERGAEFRELLLAWYDKHARKLPWRENYDPYRVWVSEIMLQQTRVAAVIEHYQKFLQRFPTVEKLAAAREASVLAAWSGLGYYRRARMLHEAAKLIARERKGKFPKAASEWNELPGIGRYTAAAVASIAFGESVAAVDGNIERVLQRTAGRILSQTQIWMSAEELLDKERPGDFNQAMMELGATVCTPRAPACLTCPVLGLCATRGELSGLGKRSAQNRREIHYALHRRNGSVLLVQRPREASLMAGLWELPEIARHRARARKIKEQSESSGSLLFSVKHSITVTDFHVRVWQVADTAAILGSWISNNRLERMPLTGLARKILRKAEVM